MAQNVLFLQGGGDGAYDADKKLADSLQRQLGSDYAVAYPQIGDGESTDYDDWRGVIDDFVRRGDEDMILVGHSLGASFLVKYLSQAGVPKRFAGLFLMSAPYWGEEGWEADDTILPPDGDWQMPDAPTFLYHAQDDEVAPFSHQAIYARRLPNAIVRVFAHGGHQLGEDLSAVAADIRGL